ncbi:MAG: exosortase family protein XrtM, partial [Pseudomonadota bacterium]
MASAKKKLPLKELKFLLLFIAIYALFQFLYFKIPDTILKNDIYYHGIVSISADIINFFTNENVTASENRLSSSKAILVIVRGCDGAGSIFLLIAAILAFSASIKDKVIGIISGIALLYII